VGISSSCFLIRRRVAEPAWSDTNIFAEILFRSGDNQTKTATPDKNLTKRKAPRVEPRRLAS
jgi:hypothetical protein